MCVVILYYYLIVDAKGLAAGQCGCGKLAEGFGRKAMAAYAYPGIVLPGFVSGTLRDVAELSQHLCKVLRKASVKEDRNVHNIPVSQVDEPVFTQLTSGSRRANHHAD